jgi:hypothetical protein
MIPGWEKTINLAYNLLKQGGQLAVTDFICWKEAVTPDQFGWISWAKHRLTAWSYGSTNVHISKPIFSSLRNDSRFNCHFSLYWFI